MRLFFSLLLFSFCVHLASAQTNYADYRPQYRPWQEEYILDKVEYSEQEIVIHFRFVCKSLQTNATFFPPGHKNVWFLKDTTTKTAYKPLRIQNVARNGRVLMETLRNVETYSPAMPTERYPYTIFTCQAVFPRLPKDVRVVDLIEGEGFENASNHFNAFALVLRPYGDPELGTPEDAKRRIQIYENKVFSDAPNRPKTTVSPKPEPAAPLPQYPPVLFEKNKTRYAAPYDFAPLVQYLRANPERRVLLIGHTDNLAAPDFNRQLSQRRAVAVSESLIKQGIDKSRIRLDHKSSDQPTNANADEAQRAQNRRVEIVVE